VLSSFTITGYSCFDHLEVPRLARVNLVTGRNGSGKTALLEALRLYADAGAWETLLEIMGLRQGLRAAKDPWEAAERFLVSRPPEHAFGRAVLKGDHARILVRGMVDGAHFMADAASPSPTRTRAYASRLADGPESQRVWDIRPNGWAAGTRPPSTLPCLSIPLLGLAPAQLSAMWNEIAFTAQQAAVRKAVRSVHPDVEEVGFVPATDGSGLYPVAKLEGKDGAVPMAALGDGVQRAFGLLLALYGARGGLLLIDEIDTGLHFRVLEPLWALLLAEAAKADVQIVATTHSEDAIVSLAAAARAGRPEDVAFIRLDARGGKRQAYVFAGDEELAALSEGRAEVR
jgi:hypothetical protein